MQSVDGTSSSTGGHFDSHPSRSRWLFLLQVHGKIFLLNEVFCLQHGTHSREVSLPRLVLKTNSALNNCTLVMTHGKSLCTFQ